MTISIIHLFVSFGRLLIRAHLVLLFLWFSCNLVHAAGPVEFAFAVEKTGQNPFAREIWAEVVLPTHETVRLPAFFEGKDRFAVRVRAEGQGDYVLGAITECIDGQKVALKMIARGSSKVRMRQVESLPAVSIDPKPPASFVFASGAKYVPVGANLAWPPSPGRMRFYRKAFRAFAQAGLNWSRVWMSQWGGLNLDWLTPEMGKSPTPGSLDLRVAENWDQLIALAEANGVYLQVVLQHHGQYSSDVDTSWPGNPWNVANPGGFLATPVEFFTLADAAKFTRMKYRYIIARWGYSPAVMAWEFFNEVHWVDAIHGKTKDEAAVARWHSEMAAYIRSLDHYHHLVTTSTEDLQNPIYADMDYFQPHNYAANMLAGVRHLDVAPEALGRPIFYGEIGDDHMSLSAAEKKSGVAIVPPIWASLMGEGRYPAQPWLGRELLEAGRLPELGAVARFIAATGLGKRTDLTPFSSAIESASHIPLVLVGGQMWKRFSSPEIIVPTDGREPVELALVPRIFLAGSPDHDNGYPSHATYHFEFPKPVVLHLQIADTSSGAGAIRVLVDGAMAVDVAWPERPKNEKDKGSHPRPEIPVPVAAGSHLIVVENPGPAGWFDLAKIDLGLDVPVLAAVGQRNADFLAVWIWHRTNVFSVKPTLPATGVLLLEDVPAGSWRATWWDSLKGTTTAPVLIHHEGGRLRLTTSPISRHAAVVLERQATPANQ